nr:hypothetical protein [Sphingomonas elodea]
MAALPSPEASAIRSIDNGVVFSRVRAASTRCASSQAPGVMPVASWKRRARVRLLITALAAMVAMVQRRAGSARVDRQRALDKLRLPAAAMRGHHKAPSSA